MLGQQTERITEPSAHTHTLKPFQLFIRFNYGRAIVFASLSRSARAYFAACYATVFIAVLEHYRSRAVLLRRVQYALIPKLKHIECSCRRRVYYAQTMFFFDVAPQKCVCVCA